MENVNKAKETGGILVRGTLKSILGSFPVGNTAVEIYNELQSKQIERKIQRLEEFYSALDEKITTVEDKVNREYLRKVDFQDVFEEATK